jgi:3-deoxy-manno-octulosonate cytidylyltransferase (CMP-KDO synthetase)
MIDEAIQPLLDDSTIPMSTIKTRITRADDLNNPNIVKVVVDKFDFALYFSRSLVPFPRDNKDRIEAFEHLGLYVYRKDFLLEYAKMSPGYLEQIEMLEQLRVLEMGYKIKVIETKSQSFAKGGFSVDTPEDRERVEKYILEHSLD